MTIANPLTQPRQLMVDELLRLDVADSLRQEIVSTDTDRGVQTCVECSLRNVLFTVKVPAKQWMAETDYDFSYDGYLGRHWWACEVRVSFETAVRVGNEIHSTYSGEIR